jgi:hypothetical protein
MFVSCDGVFDSNAVQQKSFGQSLAMFRSNHRSSLVLRCRKDQTTNLQTAIYAFTCINGRSERAVGEF